MNDYQTNRTLDELKTRWRQEKKSQKEIDRLAWSFEKNGGCSAAGKLKARFDDIISGKIYNVPWPWHQTTKLVPSLLPGKLIVFAGSPGASKSFTVLQMISYWTKIDVQCSVYSLEGTKPEHLQRLIAQLEGQSELLDLEWVKRNPDVVQEAYIRNKEWIDLVGERIQIGKIGNTNYFDILNYLDNRGKAGDRVVVVDPVTAADPDGNIWEKDRELVTCSHSIAKNYGMSVIFVTHPVKRDSDPSLEALAGGSAFQRHVQCVLWLKAIKAKEHTVKTSCGRVDATFNRKIYFLKVTDGRGQGMIMGFNFSHELLLAEQGVIVRDD